MDTPGVIDLPTRDITAWVDARSAEMALDIPADYRAAVIMNIQDLRDHARIVAAAA